MWDGFWFLANKDAWEAMPEDVREVVATNLNEAGVKEREDVAALNATLTEELKANGMEINEPASDSFREKLKEGGFYAEWKGKYGEEAWAILEEAVGTSLG
jgi:TRAP-type C4-dicarboxylate transport system substrate-binding protein